LKTIKHEIRVDVIKTVQHNSMYGPVSYTSGLFTLKIKIPCTFCI